MVETLAKVTIDEIFKYEEKVYVDPSVGHSPCSPIINFGTHLYQCYDLEDIDPGLIAIKCNEMTFLGRLLGHENAATIYSATMEIRNFDKILSSYVKRKPLTARGKKNKSLLERLVQAVKKDITLSESKEINTNSRQFKELKYMVKLVSDTLNLKKDTSKRYGNERGRLKQYDTDEEYTTICLLDSLSGKKSGLLTADTDYVNLFGVIPRVLGSFDYNPHNHFFRNSLIRFFPNLFFMNNKGEIDLVDLDFVTAFLKLERCVESGISKKMPSELKVRWIEKSHIINGDGKYNHNQASTPTPQSTLPQQYPQ